MKSFITSFLITLLPFVFYSGYTYFLTENYYKWSEEAFQLCLESAKLEINNISFRTCSEISSAAKRAFSSAVSIYNPVIILLLVSFGTLIWRLIEMNKRLTEFEKK